MLSTALRRRSIALSRCGRIQVAFLTSAVNEVAAKSFDSNAKLYNQVRPSYPPESVASILSYANIPSRAEDAKESESFHVLDLAAGSGLFTGVMNQYLNGGGTRCDHVKISAVEPAEGMRTVFSEALPGILVYDGTSTSLPFPDNHFDLVTVAQAFHWFANQQSLAEIHRVLKKDGQGTLALIWNLESAKIEWMKKLRALYEPYDADVPQYRKGEWEKAFSTGENKTIFHMPLVKKTFETEMVVSQGEMMRRVESKSYITALPEDELMRLKKAMTVLLCDKYDCDFHIAGEGDGNSDHMYAKHLLDVELVMTKTKS